MYVVLWIAKTDASSTRQVTFEQDPEASLGVPKWSPAGNLIVFLMTRGGTSALWTMVPDGSGLSQLIAPSWWPSWSGDGSSVYYQSQAEGVRRLEKISIADLSVSVVRDESEAGHPLISADGSKLCFIMPLRSNLFGWRGADVEIRCAPQDGGPETALVRIAAARIPFSPLIATIQLSPDGRRLATLLLDGATTNIWAVSTIDGAMEPLTDFGDRLILMTRAVSWSADGRHLYAAVVEYETDIVLVAGLIAA